MAKDRSGYFADSGLNVMLSSFLSGTLNGAGIDLAESRRRVYNNLKQQEIHGP